LKAQTGKQVILEKLMRRATAYSNSCSQVVLIYLYPPHCNLLLKCVLQPKIAEKSLKPPIGGFKVVQGRWFWCQSKGRMGLPISD